MRKRVILFNPKSARQIEGLQVIPYNLLALAGPLEAAGFEPIVIDEGVEPDYREKVVGLLDETLFVGISSMTGFQIAGGLALADLVAEHAPGVGRIWGGVHPSLLAEETLADGRVDAVVIGQGEQTVVDVARALAEGKTLCGIPGVAFKEDGHVVRNAPRRWRPAESFAPYSFHLIRAEQYVRRVGHIGARLVNYISSHGCPYDCGFCASSAMCGRYWTGLSAKRTLDDVEHLYRAAKIDAVSFDDGNFFVNRNRVRAILEGLVERKIDITWYACARVDELMRFDDSMWRLMRDTGCRELLVGAESGDQDALDLIGKRITVEDTIAFLKRCKKWSIPLECSLMIGFPLDPEKEFWKTAELIDQIVRIDADNFRLKALYYMPYPGSRLYQEALRRGFAPPTTLAGWSEFMLKEPHTPWVTERLRSWNEFVIKHVYHYAYGPDIRQSYVDSGRPLWLYHVQHAVARLRWRLRFFRWPVELALKNFLAARRDGDRT